MSALRRRLRVTALAVLAPVLVWLVADPLLGHRLRIADGEQTLDIGAVPVAVVALLASLSGWGLLAALERFEARRALRCHPARVLRCAHQARVEVTFQSEKRLAGLDEHQVRRYHSWTRWVTLAMLAHAFPAVVRADEHARNPAPDALVPLSCNEIQRLFITLVVQPLHDIAHRLGWSDWRRRHQQRSRTCHYQRQAASQT
ncbi:DUF6069 family protein [Streptomyces sp. NPDC001276]|uniref:DUF6069 family protein n=1 Tax=Streptomyces sp. NPDC001276 TaxID=3364555 RepID=UPI003680D48F